MRLAFVSAPGRGATDLLLAEAVQALAARGVRLAGTVREGSARPGAHPCDMDLRVLPDGPSFRISQPLGPAARGCRLDGGVIAGIAVEVEARLEGAELLVINKFGKQEALGRGLCGALCAALEMDIPVLVGVNAFNRDAFETFVGDEAVELAPRLEAILAWFEAQTDGSRRRVA